MSVRFTAGEILTIAVDIERRGSAFYEAAADRVDDASLRQLLRELSGWERGHEQLFSEMYGSLSAAESEPLTYDPDGELSLYLDALAQGKVFVPLGDLTEALRRSPSPDQILRTAISLEHASIAFYTSMEPLIPERLGLARVRAVVREEYSHIGYLAQRIG